MADATAWRRRGAYVLGVGVGLIFVLMGVMKFVPDGAWTAPFARWGYPVWFRYLVGAVELLGGLGLLAPRLASYAAATLGLVMAGAFVTRLQDGLSGDHAGIVVYALLLAWFAWEWRGRRWKP
jgi:putative oxidoreductase